jgi:hypothetical protein
MRPLIPTAALLVAVSVAACGGSRPAVVSSPADSTAAASAAPRSDRNTLIDKDLVASNQGNLYEAVRTLRPNWLNRPGANTRGNAASTAVQVYVDNQRMGEAEVLRRMSINSAAQIKFLTPSEAQARFGLDNLGGVIQVITPGRK